LSRSPTTFSVYLGLVQFSLRVLYCLSPSLSFRVSSMVSTNRTSISTYSSSNSSTASQSSSFMTFSYWALIWRYFFLSSICDSSLSFSNSIIVKLVNLVNTCDKKFLPANWTKRKGSNWSLNNRASLLLSEFHQGMCPCRSKQNLHQG